MDQLVKVKNSSVPMSAIELEIFVRNKMHFLIRHSYFPSFLISEIEEWMALKEVHEAILLLSEYLEHYPSSMSSTIQERINQLATSSAVSIVLAVIDRYYLNPQNLQLNFLSFFAGIARKHFVNSLAYIMVTAFKWVPPSHSNPSWLFFQESFAYFMSEEVIPKLLSLQDS